MFTELHMEDVDPTNSAEMLNDIVKDMRRCVILILISSGVLL